MKLRNRKKGFTLAEVLIVIAIIAILGALAVVGVNAYKKNMKVTELDNAARALFISAQNHMTAAKASGKLQTIDMGAEVSEGSATHYDDPAVNLSDWDAANYGTFAGHDFYAVKYKPGDTVKEDGLLDTMLPFGSIDDTVRTGYSYIIEVDWSTYTVYGVFVTDKDDLDMAVTSEADLRTSKDARKGHDPILGYYGGAEAGQLDESAALSVKVRIDNSQVLKVIITDETYTAGATGNNSLLTLTFTGKTSGASARYIVNAGEGATTAIFQKSSIYIPGAGDADADAQITASAGKLSEVNSIVNPGVSASGREYTVIIDDIKTVGGRHFADLFPFFTPGEDIVITASISAGVAHEVSASKMTNSLFDSSETIGSGTGSVFTAFVGNGRHLQNLEPKVSGINGDLAEKIHVVIINDLDWSAFFANDTEAIQTIAAGAVTPNGSYLSINNGAISKINGGKHIISNLKLAPNEGAAGLLGKVTGEVGFFDLFLLDPTTVDRGNISYAGAFAGLAQQSTSITKCGVYNLNNNAYINHAIASTKGGSVAGGLIGAWNDASVLPAPVITESFASVQVSAVAAAGGLVGVSSINGTAGEDVINARIERSYCGGNVGPTAANIQAAGGSAGGLVGAVTSGTLTLDSTYSTASVSGDFAAGGLVGRVSGASVVAAGGGSYAANEVKAGADYIGGAVGYVSEGTVSAPAGIKVLMDSNHLILVRNLSGTDETVLQSLAAGQTGKEVRLIGSGAAAGNISMVTSDQLSGGNPGAAARKYSADGTSYPFPTVNTTNPAVATSENKHYGDWFRASYTDTLITKTVDVTNAVTTVDTLMYNGTDPLMAIELSDGTRTLTIPLAEKYKTEDESGEKAVYKFKLNLPSGIYTVTEKGRNTAKNHLDKAATKFTVTNDGVESVTEYGTDKFSQDAVFAEDVVVSSDDSKIEIENVYEGWLTVDWMYDDPTVESTGIAGYKIIQEDKVDLTEKTEGTTKVLSVELEPPVRKEFTGYMFTCWNLVKGDTLIQLDPENVTPDSDGVRTLTADEHVTAVWDADGKLKITITDDNTTEKYTFVAAYDKIAPAKVTVDYISLDNENRVLKSENYEVVAGSEFAVDLNILEHLNNITAYSLKTSVLYDSTASGGYGYNEEMVSVTGDDEQRTSIVHFHMPVDSDTALKVPIQGRAEVAYELVHEFYNTDGSALPASSITEGIISALAFNIDREPSAKVYTGKLSDQITNVKLRDLELKGLPGSWTAIDQEYALTVKGFKPVGVANAQITPDGNAEAVIRYERNRYKVTYNLAGGLLDGQSYKQAEYYSYGEPVATPIGPVRTGYDFVNWTVSYSENGQNISPENVVAGASFVMKDGEVTVTANWKEKTVASYTVEYWVQSVNDSYKTANENKTYDYHCSTVINNGAVGSSISLDRLTNMARTIPSGINIDNTDMLVYNEVNTENRGRRNSEGNVIKIEADGTTTYRIYYDRAVVTYRFEYDGHTPSRNTGAITTRTFEQITQDGTYAIHDPVTNGSPYDDWHGTGSSAWFGHQKAYTVADEAKYFPLDSENNPYDSWHREGNSWWFGHGEYVTDMIRVWDPKDYNYSWTERSGYTSPYDYFGWFVYYGGYFFSYYSQINESEAINNPDAIYAHGERNWFGYEITNSTIISGVTAPVTWTEGSDGVTWYLDGHPLYSSPEEYFDWYLRDRYYPNRYSLITSTAELNNQLANNPDRVVYGHGTLAGTGYNQYYTVTDIIDGADSSATWAKNGKVWELTRKTFEGVRFEDADHNRDAWHQNVDGSWWFGYYGNYVFQNARYSVSGSNVRPYDHWEQIDGAWQFGHWNNDTTPRFIGLYESPFTVADPDYVWDTKYSWHYRESGASSWTTMTFLDSFSREDTTFYYNGTNSGNSKIVHWTENLPGSATAWKEMNTTESGNATFFFTNKFYGFTVYQYDHNGGNKTNITRTDGSQSTSVGNYSTLNVYHKRNSYALEFANVKEGSIDSLSLLFELPFAGQLPSAATMNANKAAYIPDGIDSDYIFEGWYKSETFAESDRVTANDVMPAYTMVVFARWVKPAYVVSFKYVDTDGTPQTLADPLTVTKMDTPQSNNALYEALTAAAADTTHIPAGYAFAGWYRDAEFTQPYDATVESLDPITEDTVLYARYKQVAGEKQIKVRYVTPEGNYFKVNADGTVASPYAEDGTTFVGYTKLDDRDDPNAYFTVTGTIGKNLTVNPPENLVNYKPSPYNNTIVGVTADLEYIDLYYDYVENWGYVIRGYLGTKNGDSNILLYEDHARITDEWRLIIVKQFDGFVFSGYDGSYYTVTVKKDTDLIAQNKDQIIDLYYTLNPKFQPELKGGYTFDANYTSGTTEYDGDPHEVLVGGKYPNEQLNTVVYRDPANNVIGTVVYKGETVVSRDGTVPKVIGTYKAEITAKIGTTTLWTRTVDLEIKPWEYTLRKYWDNGTADDTSDDILIAEELRKVPEETVNVTSITADVLDGFIAPGGNITPQTQQIKYGDADHTVDGKLVYSFVYSLDSNYLLPLDDYANETYQEVRTIRYDGQTHPVTAKLPEVPEGLVCTAAYKSFEIADGESVETPLPAGALPKDIGTYTVRVEVTLSGKTLWTRDVSLVIRDWDYEVKLVWQNGDSEVELNTLPFTASADEVTISGPEIPGFNCKTAAQTAKVSDASHTYTFYYDLNKNYKPAFADETGKYEFNSANTAASREYDSIGRGVSVVLPDGLTSGINDSSRLTTNITYYQITDEGRTELPEGQLPKDVGSYQARAMVKLDSDVLWDGHVDLTITPWKYIVDLVYKTGEGENASIVTLKTLTRHTSADTIAIPAESGDAAEAVLAADLIVEEYVRKTADLVANVADESHTYTLVYVPVGSVTPEFEAEKYEFNTAHTAAAREYDGTGYGVSVALPEAWTSVENSSSRLTTEITYFAVTAEGETQLAEGELPKAVGSYKAKAVVKLDGTVFWTDSIDLTIEPWTYVVELVYDKTGEDGTVITEKKTLTRQTAADTIAIPAESGDPAEVILAADLIIEGYVRKTADLQANAADESHTYTLEYIPVGSETPQFVDADEKYEFNTANTAASREYDGTGRGVSVTLPEAWTSDIVNSTNRLTTEITYFAVTADGEEQQLAAVELPKAVGSYKAKAVVKLDGTELWTGSIDLTIDPWEYVVKLVYNTTNEEGEPVTETLKTLTRHTAADTIAIPAESGDEGEVVLAADLIIEGDEGYVRKTADLEANVTDEPHTYTFEYVILESVTPQFETGKYVLNTANVAAREYDGKGLGVSVTLPAAWTSNIDDSTNRLLTEITYYAVTDGEEQQLTELPKAIGSYKAVASVKLDEETELWTGTIDLEITPWEYVVNLVYNTVGENGDPTSITLNTLRRRTAKDTIAIPAESGAAAEVVLAEDLIVEGYVRSTEDIEAKAADESHVYTFEYIVPSDDQNVPAPEEGGEGETGGSDEPLEGQTEPSADTEG